MMEKALAALV